MRLRSQKVLSASWLFSSVAIVVLKDFTNAYKLLGVGRLTSVSIKIIFHSSGKPGHFFISTQMRIYLFHMAISSNFKLFNVIIMKKETYNFSVEVHELRTALLL